jgi:hypothetical protein
MIVVIAPSGVAESAIFGLPVALAAALGGAFVGAFIAGGVTALNNWLLRAFDRRERRRLLDAELRQLRRHYTNSSRLFGQGGSLSARLRKARYRSDGLTSVDGAGLSKLKAADAEVALFIDGLVRNTNHDVDSWIGEVASDALDTSVQVMRRRFDFMVEQIREPRQRLALSDPEEVATQAEGPVAGLS